MSNPQSGDKKAGDDLQAGGSASGPGGGGDSGGTVSGESAGGSDPRGENSGGRNSGGGLGSSANTTRGSGDRCGGSGGGSGGTSGGGLADRHLWEFAWVRDLLVLALAALLLWLVYAASAVFTPVLVGVALAYVFNPVVTFLVGYGVPRWLTSLSVLLVSVVLLGGALLYLTPKAIGQVGDLIQNVPGQVRQVADRYDWKLDDNIRELRQSLERTVRQTIGLIDDAVDLPPEAPSEKSPEEPGEVPPDEPQEELEDQASPGAEQESHSGGPEAEDQGAPGEPEGEGADIAPQGSALLEGTQPGVQAGPDVSGGTAGALSIDYQALAQGGWQATRWLVARLWEVVGFFTWLFLFVLLASASFFFFSWHLPGMGRQLDPLLPPSEREVVWRMIERMDRAVSAWLRGRLLQSLVVAVLLSLGWWAVGVPYWLLLGVFGGVLNLIPYAAGIAWPLAVGLMWINSVGAEQPPSLLWILLAPSVVYWIAQTVDGSVMEPLVQGKATELNWLVVLVSVMAGGALFGFIGLILAIPVMACIKILWQEWLNPRLTAYVQTID